VRCFSDGAPTCIMAARVLDKEIEHALDARLAEHGWQFA
jgi:hypothetical protein